jgi:hypothetical protein
MASTDAISSVCEAIANLLKTAMGDEPDTFPLDLEKKFEVYHADDFSSQDSDRKVIAPKTIGASIFLYRVFPNLSYRNPAGNITAKGKNPPQLALDLHLLITVWAIDPNTQNRLLGWVMRTLEDHPVLPATLLNSGSYPTAFAAYETVNLLLGEMNGEELLQLWDTLGNGELHYQISIPYIVRSVMIESQRPVTTGPWVQSRTTDVQHPWPGEAP